MAGRELDPLLALLQQLVTQVSRAAYAFETDLCASLPADQVSTLRKCVPCGCRLILPGHEECPVCGTALEEKTDG